MLGVDIPLGDLPGIISDTANAGRFDPAVKAAYAGLDFHVPKPHQISFMTVVLHSFDQTIQIVVERSIPGMGIPIDH